MFFLLTSNYQLQTTQHWVACIYLSFVYVVLSCTLLYYPILSCIIVYSLVFFCTLLYFPVISFNPWLYLVFSCTPLYSLVLYYPPVLSCIILSNSFSSCTCVLSYILMYYLVVSCILFYSLALSRATLLFTCNSILERTSTVFLLVLLLLLCHAQGTPPGFWNGLDWRALVED